MKEAEGSKADELTKEQLIALSDHFLNNDGGQGHLTINTQQDGVDEEDDDFGSDDVPQDEEYDFDQLSAEEILHALNQQSDLPEPEGFDEMVGDDSGDVSTPSKIGGAHWGKLSSHIARTGAAVNEHSRELTNDDSTPQPTAHKTLSIDTSNLDLDFNAPPISDEQPSSRSRGDHDFNGADFDFSQISMTDLMVAMGPGVEADVAESTGGYGGDEMTRVTSNQVLLNQTTTMIQPMAPLGMGQNSSEENTSTMMTHVRQEESDHEDFMDPQDGLESEIVTNGDVVDINEASANVDGDVTLEDLDAMLDTANSTQDAAHTGSGDMANTTVVMDRDELQGLKDDDDGVDDIRGAEFTQSQTISTPIRTPISSKTTLSSPTNDEKSSGAFTKPKGSKLLASRARVVGKLGMMSNLAKAGERSVSPRASGGKDDRGSIKSVSKSPGGSPRQDSRKNLDTASNSNSNA